MTELLEEAFAKAAQLSEREQDVFARCLKDEMDSERRWSRAFETSRGRLPELARQAVEEDLAGRTEPLDPDRL